MTEMVSSIEALFDQNTLEELDKLPFFSGNKELAALILTAAKIKPASILELQFYDGYIDSNDEISQARKRIEEILKNLGLPFSPSQDELPDDGLVNLKFYVGKDEEHLQKLQVAAQARENWSAWARGMGEALGYPDTAVVDDMEHQLLFFHELPEVIRQSDEAQFLYFSPSVEHWPEEFELIRQQAQKIRFLAPTFYNFVTFRRSEESWENERTA